LLWKEEMPQCPLKMGLWINRDERGGKKGNGGGSEEIGWGKSEHGAGYNETE
jgi:hypothetical protein